MNLGQFSPDQMIEFCFMDPGELRQRIDKLEKEFIEYSIKIKNRREPHSDSKHNSLLEMIELLKKCLEQQYIFISNQQKEY